MARDCGTIVTGIHEQRRSCTGCRALRTRPHGQLHLCTEKGMGGSIVQAVSSQPSQQSADSSAAANKYFVSSPPLAPASTPPPPGDRVQHHHAEEYDHRCRTSPSYHQVSHHLHQTILSSYKQRSLAKFVHFILGSPLSQHAQHGSKISFVDSIMERCAILITFGSNQFGHASNLRRMPPFFVQFLFTTGAADDRLFWQKRFSAC